MKSYGLGMYNLTLLLLLLLLLLFYCIGSFFTPALAISVSLEFEWQ